VSSTSEAVITRWKVQGRIDGRRRRRGPWCALALLFALVLATGCSGGADQGDRSAGEPAVAEGLTGLGRRLPQRIRTAREVRVGSDISYAPVEFYDAFAPDVLDRPVGEPEPQVRGIDPDLATELGRKLGVRFTFANTAFDELIPSLRARKFDVIISSMTATPERAKQVSFLEYFMAGTSILVAKANPKGISTMDDLCGATVTLQAGTIHEELVDAQQPRCGAQPIKARPLDSGTQVVLEVKFGRADAALADFPVAAYNAKVSGQGRDFQVVGEQIDPGPYGIALRKDDTELRAVLQEALRAIIDDGSYDRVLTKWNVTDGALKTAEVTAGAA
jgi:polar amino acid transport system substrate-binding protein